MKFLPKYHDICRWLGLIWFLVALAADLELSMCLALIFLFFNIMHLRVEEKMGLVKKICAKCGKSRLIPEIAKSWICECGQHNF